MLKWALPSHLWLAGEETKGFVRRGEEAEADFKAGFSYKVICFVVEVSVRLGEDDVPSAH